MKQNDERTKKAEAAAAEAQEGAELADEALETVAESGETLPESALDAVSGGYAKAYVSPSDKPHGGFFKPLD